MLGKMNCYCEPRIICASVRSISSRIPCCESLSSRTDQTKAARTLGNFAGTKSYLHSSDRLIKERDANIIYIAGPDMAVHRSMRAHIWKALIQKSIRRSRQMRTAYDFFSGSSRLRCGVAQPLWTTPSRIPCTRAGARLFDGSSHSEPLRQSRPDRRLHHRRRRIRDLSA